MKIIYGPNAPSCFSSCCCAASIPSQSLSTCKNRHRAQPPPSNLPKQLQTASSVMHLSPVFVKHRRRPAYAGRGAAAVSSEQLQSNAHQCMCKYLNLTGCPTQLMIPSAGCVYCCTISRAFTCSCPNTFSLKSLRTRVKAGREWDKSTGAHVVDGLCRNSRAI